MDLNPGVRQLVDAARISQPHPASSEYCCSSLAWPKHSDFPSGVLTLLVEVFRLSTFRTVKHQGNREIFRLNRRTGG
jgi:hypothetical protein